MSITLNERQANDWILCLDRKKADSHQFSRTLCSQIVAENQTLE